MRAVEWAVISPLPSTYRGTKGVDVDEKIVDVDEKIVG